MPKNKKSVLLSVRFYHCMVIATLIILGVFSLCAPTFSQAHFAYYPGSFGQFQGYDDPYPSSLFQSPGMWSNPALRLYALRYHEQFLHQDYYSAPLYRYGDHVSKVVPYAGIFDCPFCWGYYGYGWRQ